MARKGSCCAICEGTNLPSICAACVNHRLIHYNDDLKSRESFRHSLRSKFEAQLAAKEKVDDRTKWLEFQREKLSRLKERLNEVQKNYSQGKALIAKESQDLQLRHMQLEKASSLLEKKRMELLEKFFPNLIYTQSLGLMAITSELLHKQSIVMKQICRLFPLRRVKYDGKKDGSSTSYNQICNSRLPMGLDPHSIPSEELAASLGCMMQLLNLIVPNLAVPVLHNSGFAGSCSRIWQRNSYWDARPSSRSEEYPLFIPRQNFCSSSGENSWPDRNSSNFGVASVESERKHCLEVVRSGSFDYSAASPHSMETHKDLQKGIQLLKKSVACITSYCYNSLGLDMPSDMSTFEAFSKLMATLSSSKEMRSVISSRMACSRSCKHASLSDKNVLQTNTSLSSSNLQESSRTTRILVYAVNTSTSIFNYLHCDVQIVAPFLLQASIRGDNNLSSSTASFLLAGESPGCSNTESLVEGWDLVEHPKFPPPPSENEDVEHWTRAMFIDARKR